MDRLVSDETMKTDSELSAASNRSSYVKKIPNLRWIMGFMLFLAAILNYIDRQALSILAPTIQGNLKLTDSQYGSIVNYFLVAYTASMLLSGRLVDAIGARLGMALFIAWWSTASALTGLVRGFTGLAACRFMLGLGEAGNWPASAKVVSEWFPAKERSIAIGFYTMGATLGATIAPIMVTYLALRWGWQSVFVFTGLLGFLWVAAWVVVYRRPHLHPRLSSRELEMINSGDVQADNPKLVLTEKERWVKVLTSREVWLMMIARMMSDPVWFFFQLWYAKYLFTVRGVDQKGLGITWLVFLAADIGSISGGFISAMFIGRGVRPVRSRLWAMLLCAIFMPLAPLVAHSPTVGGSLAISMILVLAHLAWLANLGALLVDLVPKPLVATAFGVVATGSALGGIMMNEVVVYLIKNYSYTHWFYIAAFLHPLALAILWLGGGRSFSAKPGTSLKGMEAPA